MEQDAAFLLGRSLLSNFVCDKEIVQIWQNSHTLHFFLASALGRLCKPPCESEPWGESTGFHKAGNCVNKPCLPLETVATCVAADQKASQVALVMRLIPSHLVSIYFYRIILIIVQLRASSWLLHRNNTPGHFPISDGRQMPRTDSSMIEAGSK